MVSLRPLFSYNAPFPGEWWQTTLAWGRNAPSQGAAGSAWLIESALKLTAAQTLFGRAERVAKDELFLPGTALFGESFTVNKLSLGYIFDFARVQALTLGAGGLASVAQSRMGDRSVRPPMRVRL